jgi:hypothetical protein
MSVASTPTDSTPNIEDGDDGISQDEAFRMLSCRRRRHVVHHLLQKEEEVPLYELSKQIAAWENDIDPDDVTYKQRMRVYTALRQSHLPKLDDVGIVEYDPNAGTTELTDETSQLEVYLDVVPHDEIPWSTYYLGLSAFSAVFVTCAAIGVFPFNLIPDLGFAYLLTALVGVSAIAHKRHYRQNRLGNEGEPPE